MHAAVAAVEAGFGAVLWFRDGIPGWLEKGYPLEGTGGGGERFAEVAEVADWIASDPKLLVVDVRSRKEAQEDPVAGSVNVPFDELPKQAKEWAERRVLLFCNAGSRSTLGWTTLVEAGLQPDRVYVMKGARAAFDKARKVASSPRTGQDPAAPKAPKQ